MPELSAYPNTGQLRVYHIEAISLPIVYNRFGDHDPNGLLYVLKQDSERIQREARKRFELPVPQPYEEVRPLVIRANVGDTVRIDFENKLGRQASLHVQGLSYHVLTSDGTDVGRLPGAESGYPLSLRDRFAERQAVVGKEMVRKISRARGSVSCACDSTFFALFAASFHAILPKGMGAGILYPCPLPFCQYLHLQNSYNSVTI